MTRVGSNDDNNNNSNVACCKCVDTHDVYQSQGSFLVSAVWAPPDQRKQLFTIDSESRLRHGPLPQYMAAGTEQ